MYEEYKELVRLLKDKAEGFDYDGWVDTAVVMEKAADAIEKLSKRIDRAVELYNRGVERSAMYEALVGIAPEPPKEKA